MFELTVKQHFDAAHALRGYQGQCENVHGHRFTVVIRIQASHLNDIGIAYDFRIIKKNLKIVLDRFDHTNLNEIPPFDNINPSSENLAYIVYNELLPLLDGNKLVSVQVWESPESAAEYHPS